MGFSWRGKTSERPVAEGVTPMASGSDVNHDISPEADLNNFKKLHKWDPFMEVEKLAVVDNALETGDLEKEAAIEHALLDDSPYPEVRASVNPTDDPDLPVNTIRAWTIGAITCTVVTACNVLLGLRISPIVIQSNVVQLLAYPLGTGWAKYMPDKRFKVFGKEFELNPGPFNKKEHTIITMMTAAGSQASYAIDILLAQELFYFQYFHWGFQIMLILATQAMGFGLAGISRRFLVWPSSMVWPATLVTTTVMNSLHDHRASDPAASSGWSIGRYKFFLIVAACTFVYEWIPEVFAQFLQFFTFVVWIAPNNVVVNQIFGGFTGLGLLPLSFDWGTISGYLLSPLQSPAFAIFNVGAGLVFMFILSIGLYYGGPDFYKYLPISDNHNYDNTGGIYNTSRILTSDLTFNITAYEEYSPLFLPATFSLSYGMAFGGLIATVTHVALFYGSDIWTRVKSSKNEVPDVHLRLMRKYKEAPEWWFLIIFIVSFIFGLISSLVYPTHLTWWAYIIAIIIGCVLIIPVGIIQAITNQQTGLNVITELIISYMLPGRPVAMMLFKSYGYMIAYNGLVYVSDMKVGHYMKVPPRSMFAAQAFAVVWLSIVQICTYNFLRGNIEGICTKTQSQGLTCPGARTFYNASVIWGVIGARRIFGVGAMFGWINWFWLIGAGLPFIQWLIARRYPRSPLRYIFFPTIFGAAGLIPPANIWWLGQWVMVGIIFNYFIRRRWPGWWTRYVYTLSGALDVGTGICIVLIGLGLGLGNATFPDWWGNNVFANTMDYNGNAVTRILADGETFGPATW